MSGRRPALARSGGARVTPALAAYIAVLAAGAAAVAFVLDARGVEPPGDPSWPALPALAALVVVAEHLTVRFRYGRDVDAITLAEAVLAPLLFAFPAPSVVLAVALAHALVSLRRNAFEKALFNMAQWALAAGVGCAVVAFTAHGPGVSPRNVVALLLGLVAVLVTNQVAFTFVLAIRNRRHPGDLLRELSPVIVPGWLGGWAVNVLMGLLYVLAYVGHPASVALFAVPLAVLHFAYRGYAAARTDRHRLSGLHHAAQALAAPLDPRDAIEPFLREVTACFDAPAAELVLRVDAGREVHLYDGGVLHVRREPEGVVSLEGALASAPGPLRLSAAGHDPLATALAEAGWRECLAAPLLDDGRLTGALVVFDQTGIVSSHAAELAVLDALARETAGAFAKGRLLASVLEERRKLDEIVSSTSDGLLTIAADGTIRSWNPALEWLTGLPAGFVVGRRAEVLTRLAPRTVDGEPVDLGDWTSGAPLPTELRITAADGSVRRLSCSYSQAVDEGGSARTLVVVARDVTPEEEIEALRAQFNRVVEAEAAQRLVVEHLQQTVMPARPEIEGADLGVAYLASDRTAPTGGDLYDWQVLPDGQLHVAVVDVLGHGVAATKDALAVVHSLRTAAVDGTPLDDLVARVDELLGAQNPELVATVVVGRFEPRTGRIRVVAGGHPPALVVSPNGVVEQLAAGGGAIGWPGAGSDTVAETVLGAGDALVLYTDGLVEARKNILDGMETLVRLAAEVAHLPAAELADELLDRALAGAARTDDSLVLVLRRLPVPAAPRSRSWELAPDTAEVTRVRQDLMRWLETMGVDPDEPALVAAELLANAVAAARSQVTAHAEVIDDAVVLKISDDGHGDPELHRAGTDLPDRDSEFGRGLYLVRALARDVSVFSTAEGSVVCVTIPGGPAVPERPASREDRRRGLRA